MISQGLNTRNTLVTQGLNPARLFIAGRAVAVDAAVVSLLTGEGIPISLLLGGTDLIDILPGSAFDLTLLTEHAADGTLTVDDVQSVMLLSDEERRTAVLESVNALVLAQPDEEKEIVALTEEDKLEEVALADTNTVSVFRDDDGDV